MEQISKINTEKALSYLKAGYHLYSIVDKKEVHFVFRDNMVLVFGENNFQSLNEYSFKELYKDCVFQIDMESEEETVDMKKDEEYYSWKQ